MIQISKDQGGNIPQISAPTVLTAPTQFFKKGYEFPVAVLVNVTFTPDKLVKEVPTPVLTFVFKDAVRKDKQLIHYVYPVSETAADYKKELDRVTGGIKHIFDEVIGSESFDEKMFNGANFSEFFENVAKGFNHFVVPSAEEGKERKLYSTRRVYLKLSYYKSSVRFPLYPNFIQLAFKDNKQIECDLIVDKYTNITPTDKVTSNNLLGGLGDDSFGNIGGYESLPAYN